MSAEITLRDVYDQQLRTGADVASMHAELASLRARVDVQLEHGQRKMTDLDERLRLVEARVPERLGERLASVERDRDKAHASSSAVSRIVTGAIALAGGGVGSAVVAFLSAGHH